MRSFCHNTAFKSFQSLFCENMMLWCKRYEQLDFLTSFNEKEKCYYQYCMRSWREQLSFKLILRWFKNERKSTFCRKHFRSRKANKRKDSVISWKQNEFQLTQSYCAAKSWKKSHADFKKCMSLLMITEAAVFVVKLKFWSFFSECRNKMTVILSFRDVISLDFTAVVLICNR